MDFDLSEEQRLLKESVDGLLNDSYDFDARKKYMKEKGGWSKAVWGKLAEQGLLGLPFAEDDGGFGAGAVETMIVMEALGKALVLEPYLATVVIGGGFLRHGGSAEQKAAHIPGIIDGSKTFAFAQLEKNSRYDLARRRDHGQEEGRGLGDRRREIRRAQRRERRHPDRDRAHQGRPARHQPASACSWCRPTPRASPRRAIRPRTACMPPTSRFTGVEVGADAAIGDPENGLPLIERVVDEARTAMCAEAVGLMDESLKTTVEYLKTRKQFGVPIGSFQTLQHRAADMFVALEQARIDVDVRDHGGRFRRRQGARHRGGRRQGADRQVRQVRRPAVDPAPRRHRHDQEAKIGHYFKRLTMIENTLRRHRLPSAPRHRRRRAGVDLASRHSAKRHAQRRARQSIACLQSEVLDCRRSSPRNDEYRNDRGSNQQ